jgi:Protoglobin
MTLLEKYGFDEERLKAYLHLVELAEVDKDINLSEQLQAEIIIPNIEQLIEDFYDYMLKQPEFTKTLELQGVEISKLKATQKDYLLSLGIDYFSQNYFEDRLRIGVVHAWHSIPLSAYLGAYRALQQLIIDQIQSVRESLENWTELTAFTTKITTLDMALATETYHDIQVDTLKDTVDSIRKSDEN